MKFFIDTASLEQIQEAKDLGILDGVTTNPSLMAKEGISGEENILNHYKKICELISGDVSAEVISTDFEGMIEEGIIEIAPLAFMRGRTFKSAFILADEMQNATPNQMKMLLTRLGEHSMMAVTGDLAQADRLQDNGLIDFVTLLNQSNSAHLDVVRFEQGDIERHDAVKEVLKVYGDE